MSEKVIVTRQGYEKMIEDLNALKTTKRREVADQLEKARAFGDLSENAEYETAKEAKHQLEIRIGELERKIAHARVVDLNDIPKDKVYLGATVKVQDLDNKEIFRYTLVPQDEANFDEGKISVTSPIGKGLLGKVLNEEAAIQAPARTIKLKIMEITYG
ncbi:MAG TPA: transcription elongation factor GreA [Candidatus Omnitrophota bacterium]|jgi:transcription elongation factor GreA|nr:MAG: Transcription elongation factor GreA [Candidatus Omnitrophica bacterium ADurb.Bin314]HOE68401.1 transcription elongation factor GreA [Candidatus Omnitrophota bacterium]HPW65229.1 transcription elongation factor GreA [Candidatus Omnitrophota bacterium]HQB94253.1 transcription elongation factor GreA [Candidatus Omnitrophota bacterium]